MNITNWISFNDMLNSRTSPEEYTQLDEDLKSRNIFEKIQLIYSFLGRKDILPTYNMSAEKSSEISEERRLRGNKAFMSKRDIEALKLYTDSIAYAPTGSEGLALAYANRSAIFCGLRKFTSALVDINRALKNGYPEALMAKLLARKRKCISKIYSSEAEKEYIKLVTKSSDTTLTNQFTDICDMNFDWKFCSPKTEFESAEFLNASKKLKLTFKDNWAGRHMVAVEDIAAGELLVVEKPYAAILFPDFYRTHCHQCFIECQSMIPCESCSLVMFCGEKCRKTAIELYHNVECEILPSLLTLGKQPSVELLGVRTLLQALKQGRNIDNFFNHPIFRNLFSVANRELNWNEINCQSNDYICVHSLEDNLELLTMTEMMERLMMAVFLLHILKQSNSFSQELTDYKEASSADKLTSTNCYIGALMLKHLLIAKMNGHYLSSSPLSKNGQRIGAGIYPLSSCFNHSCDANVHKNFYKNEIASYSVQPVLAGEQLFMDYGVSFLNEDKEQRQSFLLKNFYFVCKCDPCKYNWPCANELKNIQDPVLLSDKVDQIKLQNMSSHLQTILESIYTGFSLESIKEHVDFLKEYMMFMHCNIKKPWFDYTNCQAILQCALFDLSDPIVQYY